MINNIADDKTIENISELFSNRPDNCCTVWEIQRDYGISKQKICRDIKLGKLNGFKIGTEEYMLEKWFIERDELLTEYIKKFGKLVDKKDNDKADIMRFIVKR